MTAEVAVVILAAFLGGGGVAGAIATWRKVQPEKESIIVSSAHGALVVQAGVLDELREELERAHTRIAQLNEELHSEIERLRTERNGLRDENRELRARVRHLEKRIDELGVAHEDGPGQPDA